MRRPSQPSSGHADILAAALREFADHGFRGATTTRIAHRAGVTQPLVHHHFGSKEGLWNAALAELFESLQGALNLAMGEMEDATVERRDRLATLLRTLVRFAGRRPEMGRIIRNESSAGGPRFEALYDRWLYRLVELFRTELGAAVKDGTLHEVDPRFGYSLVVGACTQPFSEPQTVRKAFGIDMRQPDVIESYADLVVDVLLRGLGATSL